MDDSPASARRLLDLINGSWRTQALNVAAQLRLPELLADGPRSSADLAKSAFANEPTLRRLLRALAAIEIVAELPDDRFELTPLGALLPSLRSWATWSGTAAWAEWGQLLNCVRTGESGRALLSGTEGFGHLVDDPEAAAVFNGAMVELTRLAAGSVVDAYDFSPFRRVVDIGGGYGELLAAILRRHPGTEGVLFDLPHAMEGARRHLQGAGVGDRCRFVEGDFFEAVPEGADAYLLKSIIHDWTDPVASRILVNCRKAMSGDARLLLVERVVPERMTASAEHQMVARTDLHMLVALGAGERTEAEFDNLLAATGFELTAMTPAGMGFSVIEAAVRHGAGTNIAASGGPGQTSSIMAGV